MARWPTRSRRWPRRGRDNPRASVSDQAPRELDGYAGTPFRAARKDPLLQRAVPVAAELRAYGAGKARGDLIAGLTVAALAIPSAMAYAELAGLTAVAGLYALLLPTVAYALLGSSRQLIVGPEGSISALVGASVLGLAAGGAQMPPSSRPCWRCWWAHASSWRASCVWAGSPITSPGRC